MEELKLPIETKLFISENLNKYYQQLAFECRQLKRSSLIYSFKYVSKWNIFLKNEETGSL